MALEGLSVICGGLGMIEEDDDGNRIGYSKGEYCLDNLKDLLRFLRRDDPQSREVFTQVCKWNTVGKDIIPIIEHCQDDRNLVLNAVKVLVFLTMPIEPTSNDIPQQIEFLWGLKSSITYSHTVAVVVSLLEGPLENLEGEVLTEDDWKLVQLVITFFRNILAIQDISLQQKVGGSASEFLFLRDRLLEVMFQENVMDLILVITQNIGGSHGYFRQDNLLLMETYYYIFNDQDPELTARAHIKGSKVEGDAEAAVNSLMSIMEEEKEKRKLARCRALVSNSQFSGTFTHLTVDGSKTVCKGNPCSTSRNPLLKANKGHSGPSKRILWENGRMPSTKDNIMEMLHDFAKQFLSGGYNVLMQSVREDIEKEHHAIQNRDIVTFFQLAEFVMSFQYHQSSSSKPNIEGKMSDASISHDSESTLFKGNLCGPVAASMNEPMFLLVILKWRNAFDDLKQTNDYKFLSAAGSLMKIMIRMLDLVLKQSSEDSREPQTARVLLYKLFYDQTEQGMTQFLLNHIKSFNTHKQAKSDFADLVETVHVIIRLMETLQSRGTLRVSRKSRKKRNKKMPTAEEDITGVVGDHATIQNDLGVSGCENSTDPSKQVKEMSSDPIYDENKAEETTIPSQIDEPKPPELERKEPGVNLPEMEKRESDTANNTYESDISSADEQLAVTDEVDFNVSTVVSSLASNSIIQNLCWLLKFYKSNSIRTNHYIICMLRRISEDLKLSPMLYQLSLIITFHSILDEQKSNPSKEYENIVSFLTSLIRGMLKKMKSYPLLFVEVLFWKTRKECHYINCESMLPDLGKLKKESQKWEGSSLDDEVGSSVGNGWVRRSIADSLGDDEADFVIPHGIDDQNEENDSPKVQNLKRRNLSSERTERIISTSKEGSDEKEDFISEEHPLERGSKRLYKRLKPFVLNDELEEKLKDLYQKYKEHQNCSQLITKALNLDEVSPAQISNMLKKLGLNLPSKKRIRTDGSKNSNKKESILGSEVNHHDSQDFRENLSPGQPVRTRKRVRAFSEDQEIRVKALFEQFKSQKRCTSLIASALDSDGKIMAAQVSRKLKQLGLDVSKHKLSDANLQLRVEDRNDFHAEDAGDSDNQTISLLRKRRTRKRVRAFSEDQEIRVKALFEQFKGQKRCTSLIASALDSDGKITAAQVSRKLKQLGLNISKHKLSDANLQLRDEDRNDFHAEDAGDSDNQIISLLRKRSKKKQKAETSVGRPNQKSTENLSEDESDEELLSSLLGKTNSSQKKTRDHKLPGTSAMQTEARTEYQDQDTQDAIPRGGFENTEQYVAEAKYLNDFDTDTEAEVVKLSNEDKEGAGAATVDKVDNWQHQQINGDLSDELTDLGDHATPTESQRVTTSRRKLRMVIDPDDED